MSEYQNIPYRSHTDRFEKIYAVTYSRLYNFVKYYVWNEDGVKDVLQECYIRLWENLEKVKDDERIMPMLRTYAMNITIDAIRKRAKDLERANFYQSLQSQPAAADEGLQLEETMRLYHAAVDSLPPRQKEVFVLTREKGMTTQEVARELGISTHTIKRHMQEAISTLRSKLPAESLSLLLLLFNLRLILYP